MKLRIPFHRVFFSPNEDSIFQKPNVFRIGVEDLDYLKVYKIGVEEIPIFDDCDKLIRIDIIPIKELLPYSYDPSETTIALFEIDLPNIEDSCVIEIEAQYTHRRQAGDYGADYGEDYDTANLGDYSNDYGADYSSVRNGHSRTFRYQNTFNIFGYDLGNNSLTNNPDFNIYFALNTGDYSPDYGQDYAVVYQTYSDIISYRRPFTDQIYYYDATSSDYDDIEWTIQEYTPAIVCGKETYKLIKRISTLRNGVFCDSNKGTLAVKKDKYLSLTTSTSCGCNCSCGCSTRKTVLVESHLNHRTYNENLKHFPEVTILPVTCMDDIVIKNQLSQFYLDISYNNFKTYYKDDILTYPYANEQISVRALDVSGNSLFSENLQSKLIEWNKYAHPFEYTADYYGDVVLEATIQHLNFENTWLKSTMRQNVLRSMHALIIKNIGCNVVMIDNCSLFEREVLVQKLTKKGNKYEFIDFNTITLASAKSLQMDLDDGVYRYMSKDYINNKPEYFVIVAFCKITECFTKLTQDLLCTTCNCDEIDYSYVNAMIPQFFLLLNMLHSEHIDNYVFDFTNQEKIEKLYSMEDIIHRIKEYCESCEVLLKCKCK